MSDEVLRDLVSRMATDPAFAAQVRSDPQGTAASYGLTREQVDQLNGLVAAEAGAGPSMLDARLSKSSLFFGGGLDLDAHSLAGGASAVPAPSDHGVMLDIGHSGSAQLAGIQDDTIHSAATAFTDHSKGMVSLLPSVDHSVAGTPDLEPAGFLCNGTTDTSLTESDKGFEDLGLRTGTTDTSPIGSDKGFEDLGLRTGTTDTSPTGSDKGFDDVSSLKGPEVPTLSVDQATKEGTDPAAFLCDGQEVKPAG